MTSSEGNELWFSSIYDCPYTEEASSLHTLDIHMPKPPSSPTATLSHDKIWIVYAPMPYRFAPPPPNPPRRFIHGGAWRDPLITSRALLPALPHLSPSTFSPIAGLASLNYRLAPYPSHPTHPSAATDPDRNAMHPAPIHDVRVALAWLQARYGFGSRYALVGHSCGATLAFQAVMGDWSADAKPVRPMAIVGLEGIYDIPKLVADHAREPVYCEFVEGAFGPDERTWTEASPMSGKLAETWPDGKIVLLYHSRTDELVELAQTEKMLECLRHQGVARGRIESMESEERHDEVWQKGFGLAKAIARLIELTEQIDKAESSNRTGEGSTL